MLPVMWHGDQWIGVSFRYQPALVKRIKTIPLRVYDPTTRIWWVPRRYAPLLECIMRDARDFVPFREPPVRVPDRYRILGVLPGAPRAVVRAAFRALSLLLHPDRGGSTAGFQRLEKAHAEIVAEGSR